MRPLTLAALACAWLGAGVARAQAPSRAEELWERGAADWRAGKLDTGCPAIEKSYQLEPEPGALFASAECHAQWGKPLGAVQRYEAYLQLEARLSAAEHGRRLARARSGVNELTPQIPHLELQLTEPAAADLLVTLDGAPLSAEQLGASLALEVGVHWIETRRGSGAPQRVELTLARGETRRLQLDVPAAPGAVAAAPAARGPSPAAPTLPAPAPEPVRSTLLPTLGWAAGAIGATGVVVGTVAGLSVLHQNGIVRDECTLPRDAQGRRGCSDRGWAALERGESRATLATVGFGVGIAGLVTGTLLLLQSHASAAEEEARSWQPELHTANGGAWLGVTQTW